MFLVCLHGIIRYLHVVEHALQLLSKLEATFDLELGQHPLFRIIRYRTSLE